MNASTYQKCDKCGGKMVARNGKYGRFLGCSNYARGCRNTIPMKNTYVKRDTNSYDDASGKRVGWLMDYMSNTLTLQNEDILRSFVSENMNTIINAGPGSGKSFMCRESTIAIKDYKPDAKILYVVFGRANKDEYIEKKKHVITTNDGTYQLCSVMTLNGLGYSILSQYFRENGLKSSMNKDKTRFIARSIISAEDHKNVEAWITNASHIANHCKGYMFTGKREDIEWICDHFDIECSDFDLMSHYVQVILQNSKNYMWNGKFIYDFNDQLWLPVVLGLSFPTYDYVMYDEAQDANKLQHMMLRRLVDNGARIMMVGDKNQAIYGFRGADTDSMANLKMLIEEVGQVNECPLNYTRRLPKKGVRYLNQMFPHIELYAFEDNREGEIYSVAKTDAHMYMQATDLVLSRINAPMVGLAYKLFKHKKVPVILGRDFGDKIVKLIESQNAKNVQDLLRKLESWREERKEYFHELAQSRSREVNEYAIEEVDDTVDCIIEFANNVEAFDKNGKKKKANINDIIQAVKDLFKETSDGLPANAILLSTVHRAKGFEAKRVHIYTPELFPHPSAKQAWEIEQECNCKWVAYSRQLEDLYVYNGVAGECTSVEA